MRPGKILVVDEDPEVRMATRDFLSSKGYEVAVAEGGREALRLPDAAFEERERHAILDALQKARGVRAKAAKILGITERSLWYRVKKLKIQVRMTGESPDPA